MLIAQRSAKLSVLFSKFKLRPYICRPFSSIPSLLSLCNKPHLLHQVHSRFIIHGLHQNPSVSSELILRYSNLGCLDLSVGVFHSIDHPEASICSAILKSLSSHGKWDNAFIIFRQILAKSIITDESAYTSVLIVCSNLSSIEPGFQIHAQVLKLGFEAIVNLSTSLVSMYRRHGAFVDARKVLDEMPVKSLAAWTEVMSGFSDSDFSEESLRLFRRLRLEGFKPDSATIIYLLRSCVNLNYLRTGKFLHLLIILYNMAENLSVMTALLTMYCKLGSSQMARLLFDNMEFKDSAVWNVMISGYSQNKQPDLAMELLRKMVESGLRTDLFTAISSLAAASLLKSLAHGEEIHCHVIRNGTNSQISVDNSLIEMYCQCGRPEKAKRIFDSLSNKSVASLSSMIKGYARNEFPHEALLLFKEMGFCGVRSDPIIIMMVLPACVRLGAMELVKSIQAYSIKQGLISLITINTALLVSYAKCGCIEMAEKLFVEGDRKLRDLVSWNSIIGAYSKHGNWRKCFELYKNLKESEVMPDEVTFLAVLTACVNSGLVKEGCECFGEMVDKFSLQPDQEHYACMVDLLGRFGRLEEAINIVENMPFPADERVWGSLLSACKLHSDTRLAEFAARNLIDLEPENAANYVLLSNIYAAEGNWEVVAKMRNMLRRTGLKKIPGFSWLEINGHVHRFCVLDQNHPDSAKIYDMLKALELEIKADEELVC
ncbi:Pentatricopeptide repeat-containing protein [Apostasia shenzhenica]|uniref:Pentatricopeptide repeat-containing protein n=1 Tax=Apostasia shenzhenica TaxID=1088818 RepID=A0A2I0BAN3_9ASPA|nr:Pentatricopeptide repeat-containing protein [Apostasia shenzhenica]